MRSCVEGIGSQMARGVPRRWPKLRLRTLGFGRAGSGVMDAVPPWWTGAFGALMGPGSRRLPKLTTPAPTAAPPPSSDGVDEGRTWVRVWVWVRARARVRARVWVRVSGEGE